MVCLLDTLEGVQQKKSDMRDVPLPSTAYRGAVPCVHRVPGDGNCMFAAIGHVDGEPAHRVRARVVRHVAAHWETYRDFLEHNEARDWLARMARAGEWGDELVLRAFADATPAAVRVLDATTRALLWRYPSHTVRGTPRTVLYGGAHYDALH